MNQNDTFIADFAQALVTEHRAELQHSGVKGMKWGHRRLIAKADRMSRDTKSTEKVQSKLTKLNDNQKAINKKYGGTTSVSRTAKGLRKTQANYENTWNGKGGNQNQAKVNVQNLHTKFSNKAEIQRQKAAIAKHDGNQKAFEKHTRKANAANAYAKSIEKQTSGIVKRAEAANVKTKKLLRASDRNANKFSGYNDVTNIKAHNKNERRKAYGQIAAAMLTAKG